MVCLCGVHVFMCRCIYVCMEAGGWYWVSSPQNLDLTDSATSSAGLTGCAAVPGFYMESSHLQDKYFIDWAVFLSQRGDFNFVFIANYVTQMNKAI